MGCYKSYKSRSLTLVWGCIGLVRGIHLFGSIILWDTMRMLCLHGKRRGVCDISHQIGEKVIGVKYIYIYIYIYRFGPRISAHALPLDGELDFYLKMILFIKKKWLEVVTYFCFIFKRINKIRKKTLSVTPCFGKGGQWKTGSDSGVRLLVRKVR